MLYFPGPNSVTGENMLELHVHGGPAIVRAVLSAIADCQSLPSFSPPPERTRPRGGNLSAAPPLVRHADPGEFTRRAFLNDRLDLAQVEVLGDALAAQTEQQRRAAMRASGSDGAALKRSYEHMHRDLLLARAEIEAIIDFAEDNQLDESPREILREGAVKALACARLVHMHETASRCAELLRGGVRIALLGPPNVGKSSLMNRIVGREASIVSDEAGTTRDVVEVGLDIGGYMCQFSDTAGIQPRTEPVIHSSPAASAQTSGVTASVRVGAVEQEGIRRARNKALEADLVIGMASIEPGREHGAHRTTDDSCSGLEFRIRYDAETLQLAAAAPQCLIIINKCDRPGRQEARNQHLSDARQETLGRLVQDFQGSVLDLIPGLVAKAGRPILISCKEAEGLGESLMSSSGVFSFCLTRPVVLPGSNDSLPTRGRKDHMLIIAALRAGPHEQKPHRQVVTNP